MKKKKECQINNTFQIVEDFERSIYFLPSWRRNNPPQFNQPGKVKIYTPEEIIVYQMKQLKHTTFCGN